MPSAPFADRLTNAILEKRAPLCIALDPVFEHIPEVLRREAVAQGGDPAAELAAILDGIKAAKGELPKMALANRPMQVEDLIVANSADAMRAFGCSGFTVWGTDAGDAGVITTRNFDFGVFSKVGLTNHILVRAPAGKKAVAGISPPGYIGVFTGINQDGVCAFLHDGDGPLMQSPSGKIKPLAFALTGLLETAEPNAALASAEKLLKGLTPYPFSYMVRIVTPRSGDGPPARVFHIDAGGFGENPVNGQACLTTNHYLPGKPGEESGTMSRYKRLERLVNGPVSSAKAWECLTAVAADQPDCVTLHALVVYPEKKKLEIAFATIGDKLVPAPLNKPATLTFDQLFGPQGK